MKAFFVPTLLIIVSIPMILEMIPRNGFYGFRTPYTLSSDQVWYRANRIAGLALLAAGLFWLALGIGVPLLIPSRQEAAQLVKWYGLASLAAAVGVSFWLTYRAR